MVRLQTLLDRQDRCYRFGELVTGNLLVESTRDAELTEIGINFGWRTHGRGSPDGLYDRLVLGAKRESLRTGECRSFPFRFRVPNGPLTYHGHYVNVDWYAAGRAKDCLGHDFRDEQDFLVLAGKPTGPLLLGNREVPLDRIQAPLPRKRGLTSLVELQSGRGVSGWAASAVKSTLSLLLPTLVFGFILTGFFNQTTGYESSALILIMTGVALLVAWKAVPGFVRGAYKSRLILKEFRSEPDLVVRGHTLSCHLELMTLRTVHLDSMRVVTLAQERFNRMAGSTPVTDRHTVFERTFLKSIDEDVPAGREVALDCAVPVDEDAPVTFDSTCNGLEWYVKVGVSLRHWPDISAALPFTVVP